MLSRGDEFVFAQNIAQVVAFLKLNEKAGPVLSPAQLYARMQCYIDAALRMIPQLPDDQLNTWAVSAAGYVIRTQGSPGAFASAVRDALREFNSKAVLYQPETMDSVIARSLASHRPHRFAVDAPSGTPAPFRLCGGVSLLERAQRRFPVLVRLQ